MSTGANTDEVHLRVERAIAITIGARDLANGAVELAHRVSGNKEALPVDAAADRILALVTAALVC